MCCDDCIAWRGNEHDNADGDFFCDECQKENQKGAAG